MDYTVEQLANETGCSVDTIYSNAPKITGFYKIGRMIRFNRRLVDKAREMKRNLIPEKVLPWEKND